MSVVDVVSRASAGGVVAETGVIAGVTHIRQTVPLTGTFTNPVVSAQPSTFVSNEPVRVRVSNIRSTSFDIEVVEPSDFNGRHPGETIHFIVVEAGDWRLSDGTRISAGTVSVSAVRTNSEAFTDVVFDNGFATPPAVFSQVQDGPEAWLVTRHDQVSADGFDVGVQAEEERLGETRPAETVGWVAIEKGVTTVNGRGLEVGDTGDRVDDAFTPITFDPSIDGTVSFLANLRTFNGSDPATLRHRWLDGDGADVRVEEETSADAETRHFAETVDYLVIEGTGPLTGTAFGEVLTVTTDLDVIDANDGVLSLREAIIQANSNSHEETIQFAPSLQGATIELTLGGLPTITDTLTIDGDPTDSGTSGITIRNHAADPGATAIRATHTTLLLEDLTLEGLGERSVGVDVSRGTVLNLNRVEIGRHMIGIRSDEATLSLDETSIHHGLVGIDASARSNISLNDSEIFFLSSYGGGNWNGAGDTYGIRGGGSIRVEDSIIRNLFSTNNANGIGLARDVEFINSTISNLFGGYSATGIGSLELDMSNSTIFRIESGIYDVEGVHVGAANIRFDSSINNSTIVAIEGTAISTNAAGNLDLRNSLIIDADEAVSGNVTDLGGNIIDDGEDITFLQVFDDMLRDNGGPVPTLALRIDPQNPAIGAADPATATTVDQRGVPRDADPDAGAFELQLIDLALMPGTLDSGEYGNNFSDQTAADGVVAAGFTGTGMDLELSVVGYDIDFPPEVEVLVNGSYLGNLSVGPNNGLNSGDTFTITADQQNEGINIITFVQAQDPNWTWGVTDIRLDAAGDIPDGPETAELLAVGESQLGELKLEFDRDWFRVDLQEDHTYAIVLLGLDDLDPYLGLFDSTGMLIAEDDDSGFASDARLVFTAPADGVYFASAGGSWDVGPNGAYQISLEEVGEPDTDMRTSPTGDQTVALEDIVDQDDGIAGMEAEMSDGLTAAMSRQPFSAPASPAIDTLVIDEIIGA